MKAKLGRLEEVNKELWLLLSLFGICLVLNLVVDGQRMVLSFYTLPTLGSAYVYGRRHATLTALGSVLLVCLMTWYNPVLLAATPGLTLPGERWLDITVWGGVLIVTGYSMGTLYEHNARQISELRQTYHGVLMILRHFIAKDSYTENHSYRVSVYAATIATQLELPPGRVEDVRAAGLLHDIGKLDISRELLYKAARLTEQEFKPMQEHVSKGVSILEIPIEARIITVADVYDSLTSDRPYRKAMSPFDAKEIIVKGSGSDFDPVVVAAFVEAFRKGELEVPTVVV
jgi:putative nucleotidyltransferase with HDIG domain